MARAMLAARGSRRILALVSMLLFASSLASAQSAPDTDNGRYTLSQVADGYLRLDTRTGALSTCTNKGGWTCRIVPDERAALDTEIGRLQTENRQLKEQLTQRVPAKAGIEKKATQDNAGKSIELQFPPEHAKVMALFDRMWQRLVELAGMVQKKLSEKI